MALFSRRSDVDDAFEDLEQSLKADQFEPNDVYYKWAYLGQEYKALQDIQAKPEEFWNKEGKRMNCVSTESRTENITRNAISK